MRVAIFIDALGWGGAERSLLAQLRRLDYSKVSVELYTITKGYVTAEIQESLPKEVHSLYIPVCSNRCRLRISQLRYSLVLRLLPCLGIHRHLAEVLWRSMRSAYPALEATYDVAIAYQQGFMTYYVAEKVKAIKKIAWINSQLGGHGYNVGFNRRFYDKFHRVVTVSDTLNRMIASAGYVDSEHLTTIYDIIDEADVRRKAMEACDVDHTHSWIFVTVARLAPEKNIGLAVETAHLLSDRGVDFVWYIVGEGDEEVKLRKSISQLKLDSRVILVGPQDNPFKYMSAADVYVQTSRSEGFGLTIAEAKILQCPVVSTNFPTVIDQIKDGFNGLISEMNPESLADKIMTVITDDAMRAEIKKNLSREKNLTSLTEPRKFYNLIFGSP